MPAVSWRPPPIAARHAVRRIARGAFALLLSAAAAAQSTPADLTQLSLEDLLNVEVTSVARRGQKLSQSASAVYVITQEDIRRSGITTIPDALRMAPGVQVVQIDANKWAVSIRGFSGRFTRKLLVMMDGRSIYNAAFAGVYWEANDVLLEDVDRIEVIRGPGATVWGSNAVNGVINIITKHARETQGGVVTAGGGNQEGGFGSARFGGEAGSNLHYRMYSKYFSRSGLLLDSGERAADNWLKMQGGFRADWQFSERDEVMIAGDAYDSDGGDRQNIPVLGPPYQHTPLYRASFSGANVLGRWTRRHSERSATQLQVFSDHNTRDDAFIRNASFDTTDIEFQHQLDLKTHRLVWGAGYRLNHDDHPVEWIASYDPQSRTLHRVNTFVQDEIALVPEKLSLTLGSKFEQNTYTGWEVQPSASLLWNRSDRDTVWFSFARAARIPSRVDRDVLFAAFAAPGPDGAVLFGEVLGSDEVQSEYLLDYEAGYRLIPTPRLSFDLTAFYNDFSHGVDPLEGIPFVRGTSPPLIVIPLVFTNFLEPTTRGLELAAAWQPREASGLRVSYSLLRGGVFTSADVPGPRQQLHARWFWTLPGSVEWDSAYYFVGENDTIRSYHRVDTRLGWRPQPRWELSLTLQNLLDSQHLEAPSVLALPNQVGRSVFGKLTLRF